MLILNYLPLTINCEFVQIKKICSTIIHGLIDFMLNKMRILNVLFSLTEYYFFRSDLVIDVSKIVIVVR